MFGRWIQRFGWWLARSSIEEHVQELKDQRLYLRNAVAQAANEYRDSCVRRGKLMDEVEELRQQRQQALAEIAELREKLCGAEAKIRVLARGRECVATGAPESWSGLVEG